MTVLSFHPCFSGDRYIHCAGRSLTGDEKTAMNRASAVILPQACGRDLYEEATRRCKNVFPDFATRFEYPGKIGQVRLFDGMGMAHPATFVFASVGEFARAGDTAIRSLGFPLVFKFDRSDEGRGVFLARTRMELTGLIEKAGEWERTGQAGFILQEYVPFFHGVLRVAIIYTQAIAYWRVANTEKGFAVNIARGAAIDACSHPDLRERGIAAVREACRKTGINLAGFDLIFPVDRPGEGPLFLEINYYFGRRGLGGSEHYYTLLTREIRKWLNDRNAAA